MGTAGVAAASGGVWHSLANHSTAFVGVFASQPITAVANPLTQENSYLVYIQLQELLSTIEHQYLCTNHPVVYNFI